MCMSLQFTSRAILTPNHGAVAVKLTSTEPVAKKRSSYVDLLLWNVSPIGLMSCSVSGDHPLSLKKNLHSHLGGIKQLHPMRPEAVGEAALHERLVRVQLQSALLVCPPHLNPPKTVLIPFVS